MIAIIRWASRHTKTQINYCNCILQSKLYRKKNTHHECKFVYSADCFNYFYSPFTTKRFCKMIPPPSPSPSRAYKIAYLLYCYSPAYAARNVTLLPSINILGFAPPPLLVAPSFLPDRLRYEFFFHLNQTLPFPFTPLPAPFRTETTQRDSWFSPAPPCTWVTPFPVTHRPSKASHLALLFISPYDSLELIVTKQTGERTLLRARSSEREKQTLINLSITRQRCSGGKGGSGGSQRQLSTLTRVPPLVSESYIPARRLHKHTVGKHWLM